MSDKIQNVETILPFGNTLKPLVASSKALTTSDLKNTLAQKGIFVSSYDKEETLPLLLTSLLSPREFEDLKEKQKVKEAIPKRKSKNYIYSSNDNLIKVAPKLNEINMIELKKWGLENYEIIDINSFSRYENNDNQLHMSYKIKRTDLTKDWFDQVSIHEASMDISLNKPEKRLMISTEYSAEETKEINDLLIKKVSSVLKNESVIQDEKGTEIKFGDFSNSSRINFLLNFVEDALDLGNTFTFDEITNIEISLDSKETLPKDFKWMEDKVSNMKFEGKALHETDILKDNKNHPSLVISLLKINYKFNTNSNSGECVVEIEFPTKRGRTLPKDDSEFIFKFINIKCKDKLNTGSAKRILYRAFDIFKEECYKKTIKQFEGKI